MCMRDTSNKNDIIASSMNFQLQKRYISFSQRNCEIFVLFYKKFYFSMVNQSSIFVISTILQIHCFTCTKMMDTTKFRKKNNSYLFLSFVQFDIGISLARAR